MGMNKIIVFGEVLFDEIGSSSVLGGAPFNVLWNLKTLGENPLFISRVGKNDRGPEIIETIKNWDLETKGIQVDSEHPTGISKVTFELGDPRYDILPDCAYDFIDTKKSLAAINSQKEPLLYHGTLALRNGVSASTLKAIKEKVKGKVFLDLNLRSPWWNRGELDQIMKGADYLKCSESELFSLLGTGISGSSFLRAGAMRILKKYNLEYIIISRGARGAFLITNDDIYMQCKPPQVEIVDTVGAGDAFCSVLLKGIIEKWPIKDIIERATTFASRICEIKGATTEDLSFYENILKNWT